MKETLLVVDVLKEFFYGDVSGEAPEEILPNLEKVLKTAREAEVPVVYCKDSHSEGDPELEVWGEHAMKDTEGSEILERIKPKAGDHVVGKTTYNGFYKTNLDSVLKELDTEKVYVAGLYDVPCVKHTVAGAFFRGYDITVLKDATQSFDPENHQKELEEMKRLYGVKVKGTQEVIKEFKE